MHRLRLHACSGREAFPYSELEACSISSPHYTSGGVRNGHLRIWASLDQRVGEDEVFLADDAVAVGIGAVSTNQKRKRADLQTVNA